MKSEDQSFPVPARRHFLNQLGAGSVGLAVAGGLMAACSDQSPPAAPSPAATGPGPSAAETAAAAPYAFDGEHQAGIVTPAQRHIYFLVLDLHTSDVQEMRDVFKRWTDYARRLTRGDNIAAYGDNPHVPPVDTGEADSLGAYQLTLTFGVSPSFLKKLGLQDQLPADFVDLPAFPRDQIRPVLSGGDICIQSCANDPQVAFHAVRQLVRQARSSVTMKWSQAGFNAFERGEDTPRNLFGFRDGTANQETLKKADEFIWVDTPNWLQGGSYLVARKIQMHLETWDRTSLKGQEDTFGRVRPSGAPLGAQAEFDAPDVQARDAKGQYVIPENSHMGLSKRSGIQLLRRSFSYASGIDPVTGQFDAGLLFVSFQKSPGQFVGVQSALGRIDRMNEYITHIGSGLFACFGGVREGEYLGQALLESPRA
ncbi:iron uptake transporter deferrochelatase/peroxidase subunit [Hydrogenophaga electricum]|uniref:Deferrochelatase n=1 Tax=Hydrogenophaga electricum TaxID=1230953 RepID=A0ABQ6BZ80_9BURK|nr:iron uptake transporter deferrochelatase/peroxidase subunit [Hydrogenophaga electricum]GLS12960.1 peroxidase [Hydrogenophaga electricum]